MKTYQTTVSLQAARILSYSPVASDLDPNNSLQMRDPVNSMLIQLDGGGTQTVARDWFGKTIPAVGGYLLMLADGSTGYMPGAIFESIFPESKAMPVVTTPLA